MRVDWKAFGFGAGLAALAAILQVASTLPPPYGALASAALVLVASAAKSPISRGNSGGEP